MVQGQCAAEGPTESAWTRSHPRGAILGLQKGGSTLSRQPSKAAPPQNCTTGMASVVIMGSLLPGAEMGSDVSTLLTGGGCSSHRKLVRGASLLSIPTVLAPFPEEVQDTRVPAGTSFAHSSSITAPHKNTGEIQDTEGLIPGLLDEVALLCLARLPTSEWRSARQVSSLWRKLFGSQERIELLTPVRSKVGTLENWVFVKPAQISPFTGGHSWRAVELERGLVRVVPPMPGQGSRYSWTEAGVATAGGKLVCMGWKDDNIYAFTGSIFPAALSSFLWLYCPILNRWEEKKGVPSPRTHFACASDGRRVYLVGGRRGGSIMEQGERLATAWVYDTQQDRWAPIADMFRPCDQGRARFVEGKLWVVGGSARAAQVYDPARDSWTLIEEMWPWPTAGNMPPLTVHRGSITVADIESQGILQYSPAKNSWVTIAHMRGFSQPIEGKRRLCSLESDGEHLYILGGYLEAAYAAYGVADIESWTVNSGWVVKEVGGMGPLGSTMGSALVQL
ncbi:Galactose oxidase/kelch repeat superfamily protein [Klebsormidium nitens]|uniref:Galactose oxidase/kelch repeat superfamily protein n=1 Tax=Klebsormidium nitens TaxID=105231 RepID=A0A1Y1IRQ3_KLENI|nr:Galactose oxidase/kelch repeat superfamily protein [Klebsormidium nitens]|eukprot:GAQ90808.1 Galactose oxidase/kelch repeat superfamily protein [Klebsormidium nitens]